MRGGEGSTTPQVFAAALVPLPSLPEQHCSAPWFGFGLCAMPAQEGTEGLDSQSQAQQGSSWLLGVSVPWVPS